METIMNRIKNALKKDAHQANDDPECKQLKAELDDLRRKASKKKRAKPVPAPL